jgi:hypothetical protein
MPPRISATGRSRSRSTPSTMPSCFRTCQKPSKNYGNCSTAKSYSSRFKGYQDATSKYECLNRFILFGQRDLDHIAGNGLITNNITLPHMERNHLPPIRETPEEVPKLDRDQIVVSSYVGGLVKSFERKAARAAVSAPLAPITFFRTGHRQRQLYLPTSPLTAANVRSPGL